MDAYRREQLRRQVVDRFGQEVVDFLDRCELAVDRVDYLNQKDLALFMGLQQRHRDRLGLRSDELLVLLLGARDQFQWFHDEIRTRVREHARLDRAAVLIISADPQMRAKCSEPRPDPDTGYLTSLVSIPVKAARRATSGLELLETAFHEQAFTTDHFDCRVPVVGDNLFGRKQLVTQLENDIMRDGRPVGLFGLRRVGKSSVLSQLIKQLRGHSAPRVAVAVADLQRDSYNITARRVAEALYRDLAAAAEAIGSKFRGSASEAPFDRVSAITRHLRKKGMRVVLAVDEIEWLVPTSPGESVRGRDYLSVLGWLRGMKHELGDDLGIIVCGINQHFTEIPTILGYPNPVLDLFRGRYVAGLARQDFDEMLVCLGHRMGLKIAPNFLFESFKKFGGHPYLARQFCSLVAQRESGRPLLMDDVIFAKYYDSFLSEKRSLITQVMEYFRHFYPNEYSVLVKVAKGEPANPDSFANSHLRAYGLVESVSGVMSIRVDAVRRWLVEEERDAARRVSAVLPPRFDVIRELGAGATATVFHVRDSVLGEERAVKKYNATVAASAVRAELSVLREVRSPYVVTAYDVVEATDGSLCLVMEYLDGTSLERILTERGALDRIDLMALAEELFSALKSIHPDLLRIEQLQSLPELDDDGMQEVLRLRQAGHIHRDIKPSNIMILPGPGWTCKLVDLGLARAHTQAGFTLVGTEAYLPPDIGATKWNASFDLFAVGVILFRAIYGVLPKRDEAGVLERTEDRMGQFLSKALAATTRERFEKVEDMRLAFRAAVSGWPPSDTDSGPPSSRTP